MSWEIFERIYSGHWFLSSFNAPGWIRDFPRLGGGNFINTCIWIMRNGVCQYVLDSKEFDDAAHFAADRLINNSKWRGWIYQKINFLTRRYFDAGERLRHLPLTQLSDQQLIGEIRAIIPLQRWHQIYSTLVNGVIIDGRNHLSNKIRDELKSIIDDEKHFDDYWSILTLPTKMSLRQKKDYSLAQLASQVKIKSAEYITQRLKKLYQQYGWLDYLYQGSPASLKQFESELKAAKANNPNLNLPQQLRVIKQKQEMLSCKLHLNQRARFLINLAQHVIWQKGYRKDVMYHGFYCYEPFLKELVRRKKIRDWKFLFFLFPWEVENFITKDSPTFLELKKRKIFSCLIAKRNRTILKIGKKARTFVKGLQLREDYSNLKEVKGQCAYSGKTKGRVKIIHTPTDMGKMKKGDIIVSQATSPDLIPAIKKAAAIVTNTGGLICHAAITARELKIPCVVGTKIATQVLKDGDLVEVDATKGVVRIIN